MHILTSKKREGEICLILALSDLKTPLSQEKKGSSQPLILSSIFHNQSKQTVSGRFFFFCLLVWLLSHLNWNVQSSKKQTSFTLFCDYNYGEKEKKKMKPFHFNVASNGSSDFSDTFLVKCSQLLSSFETPPFFCLEYFFIHTTLIWPWTRREKMSCKLPLPKKQITWNKSWINFEWTILKMFVLTDVISYIWHPY